MLSDQSTWHNGEPEEHWPEETWKAEMTKLGLKGQIRAKSLQKLFNLFKNVDISLLS